MKYFDRRDNCLKEEYSSGQNGLKFLYNTIPGRMILKLMVLPWFSNLGGMYKKSRLSKSTIKRFAEKNSISLSKEEMDAFNSFNDFFVRKRERKFSCEANVLASPADSKLSVFTVDEDLRLEIKNTTYSLEELLEDKELAKRFSNCMCMVFRLAVDDMHHYFFIDEGEVISQKKIDGQLHTVRPISEKYRVFTRNKREVTVMETKNFGLVVQIEVGALLVGRIKNKDVDFFKRGEEKGYFEFGGSTVVLLLEKTPVLDSDIEKANREGYETRVYAGERIGQL